MRKGDDAGGERLLEKPRQPERDLDDREGEDRSGDPAVREDEGVLVQASLRLLVLQSRLEDPRMDSLHGGIPESVGIIFRGRRENEDLLHLSIGPHDDRQSHALSRPGLQRALRIDRGHQEPRGRLEVRRTGLHDLGKVRTSVFEGDDRLAGRICQSQLDFDSGVRRDGDRLRCRGGLGAKGPPAGADPRSLLRPDSPAVRGFQREVLLPLVDEAHPHPQVRLLPDRRPLQENDPHCPSLSPRRAARQTRAAVARLRRKSPSGRFVLPFELRLGLTRLGLTRGRRRDDEDCRGHQDEASKPSEGYHRAPPF